jgi:PAS domain S-box-containing protein
MKNKSILIVESENTKAELKEVQELLEKERQTIFPILHKAPYGIALIDNDGKFIYTNPAFTKITGYTLEDIFAGKDWFHRASPFPEYRQQIINSLKRDVIQKGVEKVFSLVCKNGETKEVEFKPTLLDDGRIVVIFSDITERKRTEESLKQSEENARQLAQENEIMAEIGRIVSSTLNIDEIYESFSQEVRKIIPFDRIAITIINTETNTVKNVYIAGKEVQNRNANDLYPLEGSGSAEMVHTKSTLLIQTEDFNEYIDRFPTLLPTFEAGFQSIMNVPLFSKGKVIGGLLLRSYKPYSYTDKDVGLAERIASQIAGAVVNAQLYAERIQAEEEREALQEQLRQSQKMEAIGKLAGGIAHDFNNLLTVISGNCQLSLLELKERDPLRGNIEDIKKASEKAADLTQQLLAFSRRQIMEMKVLDLNDLLKNLDKMLRRVIGEDIELVTLLAEDLGKVKADPGQAEQVIMNLAVNARDAMPEGGKLTIETANVDLDDAYARNHVAVTPDHFVMISVSDTGVGMTPEVRDRVFEPFFTTKEKGKGTGLGLSTVYGIVKQSGGNICVYSGPGKGTTFKIYLPRVDEPLEKLRERVGGKEIPRGKETILIVEDEEEVRKLAVRVLERQGYKVFEASQGLDAFLIAEEYKGLIHLLVTDVVMPKMGGRELADRIAEICPEIKVLYMSGYTDNAIVYHGVLEEGMEFIQKPFTVEGLARKVREVLDRDLKPVV